MEFMPHGKRIPHDVLPGSVLISNGLHQDPSCPAATAPVLYLVECLVCLPWQMDGCTSGACFDHQCLSLKIRAVEVFGMFIPQHQDLVLTNLTCNIRAARLSPK